MGIVKKIVLDGYFNRSGRFLLRSDRLLNCGTTGSVKDCWQRYCKWVISGGILFEEGKRIGKGIIFGDFLTSIPTDCDLITQNIL